MLTKLPSESLLLLDITCAGSRLLPVSFLPGVSNLRIWSNSVSESEDSMTNVFFLPFLFLLGGDSSYCLFCLGSPAEEISFRDFGFIIRGSFLFSLGTGEGNDSLSLDP